MAVRAGRRALACTDRRVATGQAARPRQLAPPLASRSELGNTRAVLGPESLAEDERGGMTIDFLHDLERHLVGGGPLYACVGSGPREWVVSRDLEDIRRQAWRVAASKRRPVAVMRLVAPQEAAAGELFLVPTKVDTLGPRGEMTVQWRPVGSRATAESLRDSTHGPAPYFAMRLEEAVSPPAPR